MDEKQLISLKHQHLQLRNEERFILDKQRECKTRLAATYGILDWGSEKELIRQWVLHAPNDDYQAFKVDLEEYLKWYQKQGEVGERISAVDRQIKDFLKMDNTYGSLGSATGYYLCVPKV